MRRFSYLYIFCSPILAENGSGFCCKNEYRWFSQRRVSLKCQNFLNPYLQLIIKLLTDLFRLSIIADVAEWKRHCSASLPTNWFGCCTHELFTVISTVTGSNHPSFFLDEWFSKVPINLNAATAFEGPLENQPKPLLRSKHYILPLSGCRKQLRL